MSNIKVKLNKMVDNSYGITVGSGVMSIELLPFSERYVVITDNQVRKLYAERLVRELKSQKLKMDLLSFPAGEKSKRQETKTMMEEKMIRLGCGRDCLIIALGGGVVGDLAGFVAATYMRGIPYVQIPTTLLAMVDSSVGGKTAINTSRGKNLIGVFWQPRKVIIDLEYLDTLPSEHLINGLMEAIKIFLTNDRQMFDYVERNLSKILNKDKIVLRKIVERAVAIKSDIVARDEKERNERMVLNFGHTIGHALEKLSGYKLLHGQAVALGILAESRIARLLDILAEDSCQRIERLIERLGIDAGILKRYKIENILRALMVDKKNRRGESRFVMLKDIGQVQLKDGSYVQKINDQVIKLIFLTS